MSEDNRLAHNLRTIDHARAAHCLAAFHHGDETAIHATLCAAADDHRRTELILALVEGFVESVKLAGPDDWQQQVQATALAAALIECGGA